MDKIIYAFWILAISGFISQILYLYILKKANSEAIWLMLLTEEREENLRLRKEIILLKRELK